MNGLLTSLKGIGCDTAKSVLQLNQDELIRRTDLEEETIQEIIKILRNEFE
jgi:N utilization substance protein A